MEANTYSVWQGQGFNYLFSLLPKVHVRWVSHWGLSITSSIPVRGPRGGGVGGAEPGIADHFLFFAIFKKPHAVFYEIDGWAPGWSRMKMSAGGEKGKVVQASASSA